MAVISVTNARLHHQQHNKNGNPQSSLFLPPLVRFQEEGDEILEETEAVAVEEIVEEYIPEIDPEPVVDETDLNVDSCEKSLMTTSIYIQDKVDYSIRSPGVLVANAYTVSLFASHNPSSLIRSFDLINVDSIGPLFGAPECIDIGSTSEGERSIAFCFPTVGIREKWEMAFQKWKMCHDGKNIVEIEKDILEKACSQQKG